LAPGDDRRKVFHQVQVKAAFRQDVFDCASLDLHSGNGTAHFKNVKNGLNMKLYFYLETSGGQSSNLYLNVVQFFNTSLN
jgi:hypothetical protein